MLGIDGSAVVRRAATVTLVTVLAGLWVHGADAAQGGKKAVRAKAFRSCAGLVDYARRYALGTVEPGRLISPNPARGFGPAPIPGPVSKRAPQPTDTGADGAPLAAAGLGVEPAAPTPDHSTTNVQEAGVDEPDIVKTDGSRLFAIAGGKLRALELTNGTPRLVGSLSLEAGSDHQLLLHGDRILVISNGYEEPAVLADRLPSFMPGRARTFLTEVNVGDPAAMRIVHTMTIEGSYVSARLNGGTVRIVTTAHPRALDTPPGYDPETSDGRSETRKRLRRSQPRHWLPSYRLRANSSGRVAKRRAVRCRATRRAAAFSGLDTLTVLTIDLEKGLQPVDSDTLLTDAETVYASSGSLYVATPPWVDPDPKDGGAGMSTEIHKFDISQPDSTVYRASGKVPGFLLNQFSLSEYKGALRVASTSNPTWSSGIPFKNSESFVTVLEEQSGKLAEVGRVGGLGHGQRIYSVRFIDDVGYVVTFRKVDPLYTIDLSTPTEPKVLGELEMLGYSAYLHPVGKDLLIGVGQAATDDQGGFSWYLGTQISLFDVSDLSKPVRLDQRTLAPRYSHSEVEDDHHAFMYWPASNLAVVPLAFQGGDASWWEKFYGADAPSWQSFAGAIGFHVGREKGIEEAGRVTHEDGQFMWPVRRALVVGDRLFTVSEHGVEASSLDNLTELAWAPFE